jgi:hypothetical protein
MFPLPGYDVDVRQVYTTSAPVLQSDDANGSWSSVLNEMLALWAADESDRHYYGVVKVGYGAGMAGRGFLGLPVAIGYDAPGDRGRITAHELGHTWDRLHAPCGNPEGPDPQYPYTEGAIGRIGFDPGTGLLRPRESRDVMGYCNNFWISDYTYQGVMEFRGTALLQASRARRRPSLLVWGRIENGRAILEPAFHLVTRPRLPERPGPYAIEGTAADGSRVFDLRFDATEVADDPRGSRQFAFAVPLAAGTAARLESLRLTGPGIAPAAVTRPPAALRAAPAPRVGMAPAGGGVSVRWDAAAHPMVLVRDSRTGAVLSFARGGEVTVPVSGTELELVLSDGVRSRPVPAGR